MIVRLGLIVVGLFHLVNGIAMIVAPHVWYANTPGVSLTGPINVHFIRDIGLAFAASGAGFLLGARAGTTAAALALAGAIWPALHALFHIWEWLADGFPRETLHALSDVFGVVGIAALGVWLAWARARRAN